MILREKPLLVFRKRHEEITEEEVCAAIEQLAPSDKQQFRCLQYNGSRPFMSMLEACAQNSFEISNSARPQVNDPSAQGVYLLNSRFNHSCIPNSKVIPNGETMTIFATRDIDAGEEITFCYNPDFPSRVRHDRHKELRFVCDCKACLTGTPFQKLSDMRRTLIRGLEYFTHGVDLDRKRQDSERPIIIDSNLKKAAENFNIPLSNRLIYILLTMYLLEEEGLLDDFMVESLNPNVLRTTCQFRTESNARIVNLAMAQETWLGKFCTASRLYGRRDVADHNFSTMLQILHRLSPTN